jgi:hypothetical protein
MDGKSPFVPHQPTPSSRSILALNLYGSSVEPNLGSAGSGIALKKDRRILATSLFALTTLPENERSVIGYL